MNKIGIKETMEMVEFADYVVDKLSQALDEDGKIDIKDVMSMVLDAPDKTFSSIWGSWEIADELADLDESETLELIMKVFPVIKKIVAIFD